MSLLGWKEACEDMTPEERHYYEKQSGPTKPNPVMRPIPMNDEKFQDTQHKARMSGEKFELAIKKVLEKYGDMPSYKRSEDQSANLVAEIYQFLLAFPSQRLGTVMATIVPEDRLFMFKVYDEEIIRRLKLYREFLNKVDNDIDWIGYLENHS